MVVQEVTFRGAPALTEQLHQGWILPEDVLNEQFDAHGHFPLWTFPI